MQEAIEQARLSAEIQRSDSFRPPAVGVVVVGKDGKVLAKAHRSEGKYDAHAEVLALEVKLKGAQCPGATLYTTLEPCLGRRRNDITDCAIRIVKSGIREVVVGMLDPNHRVRAKGWSYLQNKGVRLRRFPPELEKEIRKINASFIKRVKEERIKTVGWTKK